MMRRSPPRWRVLSSASRFAPSLESSSSGHLNLPSSTSDDNTSFDAFIEFELAEGGLGFAGIETKLTEPFSQKLYDGPAYRR